MTDRTSRVPAEASLGTILANARTQRGLSIEDVAAQTRIRGQIIGEIENDQFANCGGAIYARGHIRAIAHAVGVDGDALVERYDSEHGPVVPDIDTPTFPKLTAPVTDDLASRARGGSPRWATAAIAVLAVAAIFLVVSWIAGRGGNSPHRTAQRTPTTTSAAAPSPSPSPAPSATPSPTPSATRPTPAPPPPGVSVRVQVTEGASWVAVTNSDGHQVFADIIRAGDTKEWRDDQRLTVKFGNAPVVHVVVNGHDGGQPCDRIVCTVQFPAGAAAG